MSSSAQPPGPTWGLQIGSSVVGSGDKISSPEHPELVGWAPPSSGPRDEPPHTTSSRLPVHLPPPPCWVLVSSLLSGSQSPCEEFGWSLTLGPSRVRVAPSVEPPALHYTSEANLRRWNLLDAAGPS